MLHAESGDVWWTYQTQGQVKSSPCVDLKTGYVFIGSHDRHLYAFDVKVKFPSTYVFAMFLNPCIH